MSNSMQNLEEASNVASEFIHSIDNLPQEVNYLLREIKLKDLRSQEIQQEIDKDSSRYIRHSIKATNSGPSSPASREPSPKDSIIPAKIEAALADMDILNVEKCTLAQTLLDLIIRTRSRLDSDIAKVKYLQGETVECASTITPLVTPHRVTTRISRQVTTRREPEYKEEGEEDVEGDDMDAEDHRLYCFCQKQSYGDMIACDNEGQCPYEWFHLSCVGMKQPTPEKWYCDTCLTTMNKKPTVVTKKGRKK